MAFWDKGNKFPYTNNHDANLDYMMSIFENIKNEWHDLYVDLVEWKGTTTLELNTWKTNALAQIEQYETDFRAEIAVWKANTEQDIGVWEQGVLADLGTWRANFETLFATTFSNLTQIKTDAEAARDAAALSADAALESAEEAESSAESVSSALTQIATNAEDISDLKTQLSTIENDLELPYYREGSGNGYGLSNWVHLIDDINLDSGTTYKFSLTPASTTFSGTVNILISTGETGTPASTTIQNTSMPTDGYEYNYTPDQDFRGVRFLIYAPQADVTVTAVVEEVNGQNAIERIDAEIDALDGRLDIAEADATVIKNELDIVTNEWSGTQNPYGSGNWVKILENLTLKKDVTYKLEIGAASAPSGNISWVWNSLNTESPAWNPGKSGTLTSSDYQDTVYFTADQDYSGVRVQIYGGSVNVDVTAILTSDEPANSIDAVNDRLTNYGEIFKNIDGADYTRILSQLVRAIYIPDETLKGKLMLSAAYKASVTGTRYLRLYAYVNSVLTKIYESSTSSMVSIAPGLEISELTRSGELSGYALIDWNVLEDDATFSNLTAGAYVLSDYCYDIKFAPFLSDYFFWQNNYMGKKLNLVSLTAGEVSGNVFVIPHNYDVPVNKDAFYLSADIDETYITDTDAKRIRSLTPYLYFNGRKIGTVVMFDENGDPYIIDAQGNTKHITVT